MDADQLTDWLLCKSCTGILRKENYYGPLIMSTFIWRNEMQLSLSLSLSLTLDILHILICFLFSRVTTNLPVTGFFY